MGMHDRDYLRDASVVGTFSTRVYGWMAMGLGVTASVAYFLYASGAYALLLPFWWLWGLATFGIAMAINFSIQKISVPGIITLFLLYSGLEGMLFGTILPVFAAQYGGQVIWTAFATGSAIFALAMGYGMFTKSDLTSLGRILSFGLMGLIGVTLVFFLLSFFVQLQWMHLLISYLGLGIFIGLTSYDAQTIRQFSMQANINSAASYKLAMIMALKMYINVIMIFWYLLQIFSSNRK